jgi:hypothetical protein
MNFGENRIEEDEEREHRITFEIIVDAYGPEEQAMGWYYYLEDTMHFPFKASCIKEILASPLKEDEKVEVIGMPSEEDCMHEMFVLVKWMGRDMGVPLAQLSPVDVDSETQQVIEDWHYWVGRGYQLCG